MNIYNDINIFVKNYDREKDWGIVTSIDAHDCHPKKIRDEDVIKLFVEQLCYLINMKRFGDCNVVHFGEDNITYFRSF